MCIFKLENKRAASNKRSIESFLKKILEENNCAAEKIISKIIGVP